MIYLLDANVLIARSFDDHIHFRAASTWLGNDLEFAVCPFTQGALARFALRTSTKGRAETGALLRHWEKMAHCHFWSDDISLSQIDFARIQGPNQVTDAYLVILAKQHGGKVATFDEALKAVHPEVELIAYVG